VTPPALPHVPSYLACPAYTADLLTPSLVGLGSAGVGIRRSSQGSPAADIPPLRLVTLITTMPLFLAVIRAKWAICRAGQGSGNRAYFWPSFAPDSSKTPSGFLPFRNTGRRSVPAVSVPPACAAARSERLPVSAPVGIFFRQNPVGVFTVHAPPHGPIEGSERQAKALTSAFASFRGAARFLFETLPCTAGWSANAAGSYSHCTCGERVRMVWPAMHRGVSSSRPAWIETLRYATRNPELKGGTPRRT
jgi:hypothetical protein